MTRRKVFDAGGVTLSFWRRDDVRLALARREVGSLFAIYLSAHPECTQTQLALLTEHDRSDISNFVRGTRSARVADIDVLGRIADGLATPDEARILLGLAPVAAPMSAFRTTTPSTESQKSVPHSTTTGWFRPPCEGRPLRIAVCGRRPAGSDSAVISDAVVAVSRLLMNRACEVDHGKRMVPFAASGGAARHALERMSLDIAFRSWLSEDVFAALQDCATAAGYTAVIEQIISTDLGSAPNE